MSKPKQSLPVLTITDGINGHIRQYIPVEYVVTALQGLEIASMTAPNCISEEIRRLRIEIETAYAVNET